MELGRRLRWLRRARGMSQEAVAGPCGVSFQQIQKYETASSRISAAMLLKIAAALHVDVRFFYEGLRERSFQAPAHSKAAAGSNRASVANGAPTP